MTNKMRPYSIYLPEDCIERLKEMAKDRKTAEFVRNSLISALDNKESFNSGYNSGLNAARKVIGSCREIDVIAIKGEYLADILMNKIDELKE